jgi:hypothetical protein
MISLTHIASRDIYGYYSRSILQLIARLFVRSGSDGVSHDDLGHSISMYSTAVSAPHISKDKNYIKDMLIQADWRAIR